MARKPEDGTEEVKEKVRDEVTSKDTIEKVKQQTTARKETFIIYI